MSEKDFLAKASEISIRYANYSSDIKLEFNRRVSEINTENLISPKWLNRQNRNKALEIISGVESLLDELTNTYKVQTLSLFNELVGIDEDMDQERKQELLEQYLKNINNYSLQIGGLFSLLKSQFEMTRDLYLFFEERDEFIDVEDNEYIFEYDEDIVTFNTKIAAMTEVFNKLQNFAQINEKNMRLLAEKVGIYPHS